MGKREWWSEGVEGKGKMEEGRWKMEDGRWGHVLR